MLYPDNIKISRSLRKTIKRHEFNITADTAFDEIIKACAGPRKQSPTEGTWITAEMIETYSTLHQQGYAHSIEVWKDEKLVGGLYGLALGAAFFGESMFSYQANASKLALVSLAAFAKLNNIAFIDCQLPTKHLTSMGAIDMSREQYLDILCTALKQPDSTRQWHVND
jgi:leucyl/phenylalanyl-tRNA--protein transferase